MPLQSLISFQKVQDDGACVFTCNADECRPKQCMYCGECFSMWVHAHVRRYCIGHDHETIIYIVHRYICKFCRRTITELPPELHAHRQYSGAEIKRILEAIITAGHTVQDSSFTKPQQREIYRTWHCREETRESFGDNVKKRLENLKSWPSFCMLLHEGYSMVWIGSGAQNSRNGPLHGNRYLDVWSKPS